MKTVTNKTRQPLRIPLPGGKALHLGPAKSGQIHDHAAEAPAVQKLVKEGKIVLLAEGAHPAAAAGGKEEVPEEATHGHPQPKVVLPKGNR